MDDDNAAHDHFAPPSDITIHSTQPIPVDPSLDNSASRRQFLVQNKQVTEGKQTCKTPLFDEISSDMPAHELGLSYHSISESPTESYHHMFKEKMERHHFKEPNLSSQARTALADTVTEIIAALDEKE